MRTIAILILFAAATQAGCTSSSHPADFSSADDAVAALLSAARDDSTKSLLHVLGNEAKPLIDSGDPVQDSNARRRFVAAFDAMHALEHGESGALTLVVGADQWPFPIPLVQKDSRWRFDGAAGAEEVVNRRIGGNELATIQSCLAFVDAEREYYMRNPQGAPLLQFAQKLVSSEGERDGLYWPTREAEVPSPLGASFAQARAEGYFSGASTRDDPYHGYLYKLLVAQGPNAEGGAYEYVVRGTMLGGFALLAFPADYGASGVMTFIVSHTGVVFSKDLGPDTAAAAAAIDIFDPDPSWKQEISIK